MKSFEHVSCFFYVQSFQALVSHAECIILNNTDYSIHGSMVYNPGSHILARLAIPEPILLVCINDAHLSNCHNTTMINGVPNTNFTYLQKF